MRKLILVVFLGLCFLSFLFAQDRGLEKSHFGVQAGIDAFPEEMQNAGVEITREWIDWNETEPQDDHYNWAALDKRVQAANQAGIEILGFFIHMPAWAKKDLKQKIPKRPLIPKKPMDNKKLKISDFCAPKDINDFREFARAVAQRYDGKHGHGEMQYIEILNEVTLPEFFDIKNTDYEPWLINGYKGVKEGNPEAKVLIGGFVNPLDAKDFVDRMLGDYNQYYDIVNFHTYKLEAEVTTATNYLKKRMQLYRVNKPIWLTETAIVFPLDERIDW